MKKLLVLTSLGALLATGAEASNNRGAYVAGFLTFEVDNEEVAGKVAAGYAFENGVRVEVDFMQIGGRGDMYQPALQFGLSQASVMYDFQNAGGVKGLSPYLGVGVVNADWVFANGFGDHGFGLGAAAIAGISYDLTSEIALDFRYSFQMFADMYFGEFGSFDATNSNHEFRAGIRYNF